jgi:excisionase family DNA binding protein
MHLHEHQKLVYGIKDAVMASSLSRSLIFEKIASGELKSFRIGTRRLIHAEDLASFINGYRNSGDRHVV